MGITASFPHKPRQRGRARRLCSLPYSRVAACFAGRPVLSWRWPLPRCRRRSNAARFSSWKSVSTITRTAPGMFSAMRAMSHRRRMHATDQWRRLCVKLLAARGICDLPCARTRTDPLAARTGTTRTTAQAPAANGRLPISATRRVRRRSAARCTARRTAPFTRIAVRRCCC